MKKLVYIAQAEMGNNQHDGVIKKILSQYQVFRLNFETYIIAYSGNDICVYHEGNIKIISDNQIKKHRRYKLFECAYNFIKEHGAECCYIRYGYSDYCFLKMVKKLKVKCNNKIIVEIPTYPYDVELNNGLKFRILKVFDKVTRKMLYNYVDRIATFSKDKKIFGIQCLNIINGIIVDDISIRQHNNLYNAINLIAIASMEYWHGYERLIEGLHQYFKDKYNREIILHVIGDGNELMKYKQLVRKYNMESNVIFYGFKSGKELDEIYDKCNIAVECLGAHRKKLYLSSSLKSREYGAKGLPIISSCKIDVFPEDYKYILYEPADEDSIDIKKVIEFYDSIYTNSNSFNQVNSEIRKFTQNKCDMFVVMNPIIDFFTL